MLTWKTHGLVLLLAVVVAVAHRPERADRTNPLTGPQLAAGLLVAGTLLLAAACSNEPPEKALSHTAAGETAQEAPPPCRPLDESDLAELIARERAAVELEAKHRLRAIQLYEEASSGWAYMMSLYGPDSSDANITIPDDPLPAAEAAREYAELAFAMTPGCEFLQPPLQDFYSHSGYDESDYLDGRIHREHIWNIWTAADKVEEFALEAEGRAIEAARLVQRREAMLELGPQPPEFYR